MESKLPAVLTDIALLKTQCDAVTLAEGEEIAKTLFAVLTDRGDGVGLSAPQIGINKRVCVVNNNKPIYLINPKIELAEGLLVYVESCLSFPNVYMRTERPSHIIISADNLAEKLEYDVSDIRPEHVLSHPKVFEMVALQHEIDHLDGKLMFDREYHPVPFKNEKILGRNESVTITDGKDTITMKYKKAENLLQTKKWSLV
jgi:peptide deformylase